MERRFVIKIIHLKVCFLFYYPKITKKRISSAPFDDNRSVKRYFGNVKKQYQTARNTIQFIYFNNSFLRKKINQLL